MDTLLKFMLPFLHLHYKSLCYYKNLYMIKHLGEKYQKINNLVIHASIQDKRPQLMPNYNNNLLFKINRKKMGNGKDMT